MTHLKAGQKAPDFSVNNQNGEEVSLSGLKGQKFVLFFYPKDNTPTCTIEACNLRDNHERLLSAGYKVYGISPDTEKKHQNFIKKFKLPYDLLADTEKEMLQAYGVWAEKSMFGKKYMGVLRTTVIVNEEGVIEEVIDKVKSANHSNQILN